MELEMLFFFFFLPYTSQLQFAGHTIEGPSARDFLASECRLVLMDSAPSELPQFSVGSSLVADDGSLPSFFILSSFSPSWSWPPFAQSTRVQTPHQAPRLANHKVDARNFPRASHHHVFSACCLVHRSGHVRTHGERGRQPKKHADYSTCVWPLAVSAIRRRPRAGRALTGPSEPRSFYTFGSCIPCTFANLAQSRPLPKK